MALLGGKTRRQTHREASSRHTPSIQKLMSTHYPVKKVKKTEQLTTLVSKLIFVCRKSLHLLHRTN